LVLASLVNVCACIDNPIILCGVVGEVVVPICCAKIPINRVRSPTVIRRVFVKLIVCCLVLPIIGSVEYSTIYNVYNAISTVYPICPSVCYCAVVYINRSIGVCFQNDAICGAGSLRAFNDTVFYPPYRVCFICYSQINTHVVSFLAKIAF
jgi:hypothetical protein